MYRLLLRIKRFLKKYLKVKAESRQEPISGSRSRAYKFIMLGLAAMLITLLYPAESLFSPLNIPRRGEIATEDFISSMSFTIMKSEGELKEEQDAARNAIPIIVEYNTALADSALVRFEQFMSAADTASRRLTRLYRDSTRAIAADSQAALATSEISRRFPLVNPNAIKRLLLGNNILTARKVIRDILENNIYFSGVLTDLTALPNVNARSVIVRIGPRDVYMARDRLVDRTRAFLNFRTALKGRPESAAFDIEQFYELGRQFIIPNLTINYAEMEARQEAAMAEISPIKETLSEGDVIVSAGDRVSERQELILRELSKQKEMVAREEGWHRHYIPVVARFLLILAIFVILYLHLYHFRRLLYLSNPKILALFLIFGLELFLIYVVDVELQYSIYLYPIPIFAMLMTILFDVQIGMLNTFLLAALLGILHRFNFPLVLITIFAGTVACYSTRMVRRRSDFMRAVLYMAMTYVGLIYILESFQASPFEEIVSLIGLGLFNAVMSPLLTIGILPFFESLFGFTTDITLLELSDLNHPLLKRLALEAPGTYHHSIIVGNLAENAAKAIGANPLLARVGAYYHDIGKIEIPEYFVENQLGIKSRHESLSPSMSAIILASHVKKGRVMGEEADLPDEVLNFIEEHHGTMPMNYFINKAREMGMENMNESEFHYPGPKPQMRETATVMLADSVEAASRTLTDPKPARLRNLVQNIINDRFQSGELEECPLTLKDLAMIRESFVQILIGVFHQRVEYPKREAVR